MTLDQYIQSINAKYQLGNATEHTFRGILEQLIESLVPDVRATNEPKRIKCGAPDYILTKKEIEVGYIEAKDIGDKDLAGTKKTGNKEQFDRYKSALPNLIFTDYLDFHLYIEGVFITKIAIAEIQFPSSGGVSEGRAGQIVALPQNFATFTNLLKDFCGFVGQTIKSPKKLAEMMAGKARLLSDVIGLALTNDENNSEDSTLKDQMNAFKEILIHDITPTGFADVYAQTIAYGMFAARLHDPTLPTFSRQEAAELIPKSNPFLRKLFGYIAGPDIDDRIKWIVDSLVEIFLACNVEEILKNYGKSTKMEDPIIHFYETFLSEYDPKLRKARGVWYTPKPVVNFIVRAVDEILKTEFDLPQGLADTSKTKIKVNLQATDKRYKDNIKTYEEEVHKVQILDPATGTGTFLAEVVKHIHAKFKGQQGIWSNYVETHLLPRLNGFELLMASYAMAHLQMDLLLTETGFKPTKNDRFRIYLTNSLEESHPDTGTLFANWLSSEANEANHIKRDSPVMCVIGNPPYSGESANKGDWIMKLMEDYKKEPGGKEKLKEQNSKFINDDYVKFLRYGQHFIEKNGSGIVAFINPHGFLDNPTFRGMRWNLLKTYDKIYTIDLHGNAKKKEVSPDGSADINVFDIEQGVSINIFVKTGKKKENELGQVFHYDLFGKRDLKYDFLYNHTLKSIDYRELPNVAPNYFFLQKDFVEQKTYDLGFSTNDLFKLKSLGLLTKRDDLSVDFEKEKLESKIKYFLDETKTVEEVCKKFNLVLKDNDKWDANITRANVSISDINKQIKNCQYRPFDNRKVFYNNYFVARPNIKVLSHFNEENLGLIIGRQGQAASVNEWNVIFICKDLTDQNIYRRGGGTIFPLYIYPEKTGQLSLQENPEKTGQLSLDENISERTPNLNIEIIDKIAEQLNHVFLPDENIVCDLPAGFDGTFSPLDILDYIYAVLHSPTYREKYKEFLKIDFPRIPYPKDAKTFWQLVELGSKIRQIHLLESAKVEDYITEFPIDGDCIVTKPKFEPNLVKVQNLDKVNSETEPTNSEPNLVKVQNLDKVISKTEPTNSEPNLVKVQNLDKVNSETEQTNSEPNFVKVQNLDKVNSETEPTNDEIASSLAITGRVYINETQYFDHVPEIAWNFYIGGYQPAQKWLKDRKDRKLEFEDIAHYQKIIVALAETDRLMKKIDGIEIED